MRIKFDWSKQELDLIYEVLKIDPAKRDVFLNQVGVKNPNLRARIDRLLAIHPTIESLFVRVERAAMLNEIFF